MMIFYLSPTRRSALACGLNAHLTVTKIRGANAHHIVESSFKAFARALRAAIDAAEENTGRGMKRSREDGKCHVVYV